MSWKGKWYLAINAREAAHIYRDLLATADSVHGQRNVSRETHDHLIEMIADYLEVAYYGEKADGAHFPIITTEAPDVGEE